MSLKTSEKIAFFWFRRDLRLHDNAGLYHALRSGQPVVPVFIFDKNILDDLSKDDARVTFIYDEIEAMRAELHKHGADLLVEYGKPEAIWRKLAADHDIVNVYTNSDYEPYAVERDEEINSILQKQNASLKSFKDQVIFEKKEVLTMQNSVYTVFTPYSRAWMDKLNEFYLSSYPTKKYFKSLHKWKDSNTITLGEMGFEKSDAEFPSRDIKEHILREYGNNRDFPAKEATSRIGMHLRFGTVSIRELAREAKEHSKVFLGELIWRDFYQQILSNFPHVGKGKSFKPAYDHIKWTYDKDLFKKWCDGETGYPLVDAGMRQLNKIGFMHNRLRMVTASFLAKHLLIDWRLGEAYFAEKLLDYDLAANNGGWQWSAGSGNDAAPYFRIFNPEAQQKRFDPNMEYIKKWVPEFGTNVYPEPIVDHKEARERCLSAYKKALDTERK